MSFYEKCAYFDVVDESGMEVMPGATYHTYEFCLSNHHCVMVETVTLNV